MEDVVRLGLDVLLGRHLHRVGHAGAQRVFPQRQKDHGRQHQVHRVVQVHRAELAPGNAPFEDASHQRMAGKDDLLLIELGDFGEVLRLAQHQLGDAGRLGGANPLPTDLVAIPQHLAGGAHKAFQLVVPFGKAPGDVLAHHGLEEFFLAGEVQKQRAFGHSGARRHLVHPCGGKPLLDKQVECGLQQLSRAGFFTALALGACGCRRGRGCGRHGV